MSDTVSLIFHTGALGDFVLTWPLAMALRERWSGCPVVYVTHPSKGQLADRFLGTQSVTVETGGWHSLYSDAPALHVASRDLVTRAERIIIFGTGENGLFTQNLQRLSPGAKILTLAPLPPAGFAEHATSFLYQQLCREAELAHAYEAALQMLATRGLPVPRAGSSRILIHPGSGSVKKCWPIEYFLEVAGQLRGEAWPVEFVVGEAELERFPERVVAELSEMYPVHRPGSYLQLAEELLNCHLLLTNDNGPGHLAGVLGVTTLSLFGPTDPRVWRPIGPRAHVVRGPALSAIGPAEVLERIGTLL